MKRVLITGASSPLGEQLIERLLDDYMIDYIFAIICLAIIGGLLWITEPGNKYASRFFKNRK